MFKNPTTTRRLRLRPFPALLEILRRFRRILQSLPCCPVLRRPRQALVRQQPLRSRRYPPSPLLPPCLPVLRPAIPSLGNTRRPTDGSSQASCRLCPEFPRAARA